MIPIQPNTARWKMPSSNPRNRVVVFRLTQHEYENLKEACSEKGARNLSEFTRSELLTTADSASSNGSMWKHLLEMDNKISQLQNSVQYLTELLDSRPNGREE